MAKAASSAKAKPAPRWRARVQQQVDAMRQDIARLEADAKRSEIKLFAGERVTVEASDAAATTPGEVLYRFTLRNPQMRLPDDVVGRLIAGDLTCEATLESRHEATVVIAVRASTRLPDAIPDATLTSSDTDVSRRMADALEELLSPDAPDLGLLPRFLDADVAKVGTEELPKVIATRLLPGESTKAVSQALGSEVTYLWGPPGTGKTFTIAALVASLVEMGERVLVASPTHAAAEQALHALVRTPEEGRDAGLFFDSKWVERGQVLKLGELRDAKIPPSCHYGSILESKGLESKRKIDELQREIMRLDTERQDLRDMQGALDLDGNTAPLEPTDDSFVDVGKLREEKTAELEQAQGAAEGMAERLLGSTRAAFLTLAKLMVDRNVHKNEWDTVIIDEASMAQMPTVSFAASQAAKRFVICGDFYQLPPVVRGLREGMAAYDVLATDAFSQGGVVEAVQSRTPCPPLAKLSMQRRMHPAIAQAARELLYGPDLHDHQSVVDRPLPDWLAAGLADASIPKSPLVVYDTVDTAPACKSVGGSLLNVQSALITLELAAFYAARIPRPVEGGPKPIGIVTPYRPQLNYLNEMLKTMGHLSDWVTAGTVHTFQGNECDVVLFDATVGGDVNPGRVQMTQPHAAHSKKRDLNVAVTRARFQFCFIGDSSWFARLTPSQAASAYGTLWSDLRRRAARRSVHDGLGATFADALATSAVAAPLGLTAAQGEVSPTFRLLDQTTFIDALLNDVARAQRSVVLHLPPLVAEQWQRFETHLIDAVDRGLRVEVGALGLDAPAWQSADVEVGRTAVAALRSAGATVTELYGLQPKTIVIDDEILYEGNLQWGSHPADGEYMARVSDRVAVSRMAQTQRRAL